jgi:hypothetical protein
VFIFQPYLFTTNFSPNFPFFTTTPTTTADHVKKNDHRRSDLLLLSRRSGEGGVPCSHIEPAVDLGHLVAVLPPRAI